MAFRILAVLAYVIFLVGCSSTRTSELRAVAASPEQVDLANLYGYTACNSSGFSTLEDCVAFVGGTDNEGKAVCNQCGGHNKGCYIPGSGAGCCPASDLSPTPRGCWNPLKPLDNTQGNACESKGYSTSQACEKAAEPGKKCSYCAGHNSCYVPHGGGCRGCPFEELNENC